MRPAARAQAAIELLDQIARDTAPADRLVAGYFRARRYAGAKDRAAINDIVYGVLRHRGDYAWHGGGADSRGLVLAHLMRRPDADAEAIEALFDGGRFAPAPLETAEREILDRLAGPAKAPAPAWARGNYPAWLHEGLESQFGDGLATEMAALNGRAPVDLRVNTLKSEPAEAAAELAADGIATRPGRWSPACLSLAERTDISRHRLYRDGHVEVQDQGSQIAALLTGGAAGEQVVDYCAGGGGKSLALAAMMGNRGQIFAFDQDPRRLRQLHQRAQRAGARNLQIPALSEAGAEGPLAALRGRADMVLADVPCSGSGAWRRNPEARWRLTPEALTGYCDTQRDILARAAELVRPGGRLIYVTCSLLPAENGDQITGFLATGDGFEAVPVTDAWPSTMAGDCPADGTSLQLTPARHDTDGFFIAVMRRRAL